MKKCRHQKAYFDKEGVSLLSAYLQQEQELKERILFENDDFIVLVPYWAVWPFETMIVPKRQQYHIGDMTPAERQSYAECIQKLTKAYDRLFDCSFPYSAGIHQAPTDGLDYSYWHWHMSFYPPLLRSATVKNSW